MKTLLLILLFLSPICFAEQTTTPSQEISPVTQPSAQVSVGPSSQSTQHIKQFYDQAEYKSLNNHDRS